MGYRNRFLWVLESNQRARAFYERMGFQPDGTYMDDEIGGMPVREMQYRRESEGGEKMSTAVFMHREVQIRQWFSMWLDKQDTGIGDLFAPDAVYIESWGPEYHGSGKIKLWFDEWNTWGAVERWDIRQYFHRGNQTVVEWAFRCAMTNDTVQSFDGLSLIRWNKAGQICFLQEFGCNENRYDPYTQGKTPVFREEQALWL